MIPCLDFLYGNIFASLFLTKTLLLGCVNEKLLSRLPYLINLVLGGQNGCLGQGGHQIANRHLGEVTLAFKINRAERQIGKIAHKVAIFLFFMIHLKNLFSFILILFAGAVPYALNRLKH